MTDWCVIPSGINGADRPEMRDLNKYVVQQQAAQWEALGLELGLKDYHIAIISKDHPNNSVTSCRMMLQKWLDTDPLASWSKLDDAVKKIRSLMTGPVSIVSNNTTENSTPLLKDLYIHITPQYAADWKVIGTLLGLPCGELNAIEAGYPTNIKWCCNQMLEKWLEMDTTASWGKLFAVIESPSVSTYTVPGCLAISKSNHLIVMDKEADAVAILSNRVRQINSQARLMVDDDSWPPEQLKSFTPLLLIYYQGHRNSKQVKAMAKLMHTGEIMSVLNTKQSDICHYPNPDHHETLQEVLDATIVTKKMEEILTPLEKTHEPHLILIEGAPGIGKTVLLKEIAYQWSKARLLQTFKVLLLVCLRDPIFQQAESISDLLRCFCKGDANAIEIATACSKYLFENGGKDILFLFDGFDELPEKLRTNSLIANILKRCVLPYCSLIVSSRPHASKHLHKQASLRVEILGFGEKEQQDYIQQVLQDQPDKIKELTQYLEHHLTVVSLCYVPFNLSVLLYLYKQGIPLPKSSTELYNCFICHTICRHLTRHGYPSSISNLSSLPEPYNKIIQQLSKLSLEALKHNKLVFTLDEIRAACPDIMAVKGDINGCGLLQAVECFSLTGTMVTLNFLHYSIQEYLAAHYIASLPAEEELKIIEKNFWNDIYFNVFTVYITLTQGQKPAFKYFLSGGNKGITISKKFLDNPLQCLFLYRCFHEAGDDNICKAIEQSETSYANKEIKFSCTTLTASNMECITVFLTSAFHKQWEKLSLYNCHIQDHGLNILHLGLCRCGDVTMNTLRLSRNVLTIESSPLISEITVKCKVKVLSVTGNFNIGENQHLYSILTNPLTVLEELYMYNIKLSSKGASYLFKALKDNKRLRELYLTHNAISDDACDAIVEALNNNNSLIQLHMSKNPLTGKAVVNMLDGLKTNNALRLLWLPKCPEDTNKIVNSLQDTINRGRESRGCQVKLMIICS